MLYQLLPELVEIPVEKYDADRLTAGFISFDELEAYRQRFGFSEGTILECAFEQGNYRNAVEVYENYFFGLISIVDAEDVLGHVDKVAFFIKRNLFLLVCVEDLDGSTRAAFESSIRRYRSDVLTLEKVIYAVLDATIAKDSPALAKQEFEISAMEEQVVDGRVDKDFNGEIFEKKKELLLLRNYYEQLIDIGESLQENENDVFETDTLHYITLFTAKAERLSRNVQLLRDSLTQLREAHQADMDYSLNSVMKLLSVITTIFLPLSLLVGWYGMNFQNMPELEWEYGYPVLIILSLAIIACCFVYFKKKKWF